MKKEIKHFNELEFTVVATPDKYVVDFAIYDHEGMDINKNPLFHRKGSVCQPDPVNTFEESEPYITGSVKWDGCSNWNFDENDRAMLHGCDKKDIVRFGLILGECWEWTNDLCENWNPC